ncbi:hypothetical protein [Streptomyces sp. SID12501]|uniref:Uncharacterized protein n=1 Tax=Streptomyces sp. SID12501 TaxID=2706042 RepID=A0A6B3C6D2_9ACTN|nr:hypothetical protein [Streptomyces sp. SID12501]NEC91730.1 hypothetical protein [Streptomyces sp. SID12501]
MCGPIDTEGKQQHLLSVFRPETGTAAAQRAMRGRGCEVTHFMAAPDFIVTADALHCRRSHAIHLSEHGASS